MACSLYCLMTETDISKLSRYDIDILIQSEIKINGKRTTLEKALETNALISAILDKLIEFISTKNQSVLHSKIRMKTKPARQDDFEIDVVIPENYKQYYQVKIIGDIIYIYDKYEKLTITINPKRNMVRDF